MKTIPRNFGFAAFAACLLLVGCATTPSANLYEPPAAASDQALAAEITQRLAYDAVTGNATYGVSARDGVVTLSGSVHDETVRLRALGIARATPGVTDVVDKLQRW